MDDREVIARGLCRCAVDNTTDEWVRYRRPDSWKQFRGEANADLAALEASGRVIVPVEATPYEELAVLHGQQVVVTFKDSKDAFELFNAIKNRTMIAAAKEPTDGR